MSEELASHNNNNKFISFTDFNPRQVTLLCIAHSGHHAMRHRRTGKNKSEWRVHEEGGQEQEQKQKQLQQ